jgi:predicted RND superfamily exporter protein/outer membrane lipoprotein-sorting protein
LQPFVAWVVRQRLLVVAAFTLITLLLLSQIRSLQVIVDPDETFPQSHPFVVATNTVEQLFGNKYAVVIGVTAREGDVFQPKILAKVAEITKALSLNEGVVRKNLLSLAARRARSIEGTAEGMEVLPLMEQSPATAEEAAKIREAYRANPVYHNALVSTDEKTTAILVEFRKDPKGFRAIDAAVRSIVDPHRDESVEITIAGQPVLLGLLERFSQRMGILFPLAVLLIGLIHYEAFRSVQGLILPLVTALVAVFWALGLMAIARVPFDVFNATTPILILAIAAGHAVQILKRYYEEYGRLRRTTSLDPRQANREAVVASLTKIGPVMIAAGVIAAASFFSLIVFEMQTLRTFGVFTAAGILSALVIEFTLIPAVRAMLRPPSDRQVARESGRTFWDRLVEAMARLVTKRRGLVFAASAAFCLAALGAASLVHIDNSTRGNFSPRLEVRQDDAKLNARLGGSNTLYVLLQGEAEDSLKDPAVLRAMDETQRFLSSDPQVGKTLSLVDFLRRMNQAMNADDPAYDRVPESRELVSQYLFLYSLSGEPGDFDSYVDYTYRNAAIQVLLKTDSAAYISDLAKRIRAFIEPKLPAGVKVSIGGSSTASAALNEVLVRSKLYNIAQIAGVVLLISALLFRSVLAGLLVLVPLAASAMATFGTMGLTGIPLSIATASISALVVGIGADYAIYYTYRLREEIRAGRAIPDAVAAAHASAGKAALFVASAITGGYLLLLANYNFNVHIWLGSLVALSMVVSVIAALTLFPALLTAVRPRFVFGPRARIPAGAVAGAFALLLLGAGPATASAEDAVQIMESNYMANRVADSASQATMRLTNASGQERVRKFVGRAKLKENGVDYMRMTRFSSPADVKNTVSLLIENAEGDDDIWIYLPALKKVRRLVAANKRDAFIGTDFSYGDMIGHKVADWRHRIAGEEVVDGRPAWIVESLPADASVQANSGYSKRVSWIDKERFVTLKSDLFDESGRMLKQFAASDFRLVDETQARWQAMRLESRNTQTGHRTTIEYEEFAANVGVPDDVFTTRYMEREQ